MHAACDPLARACVHAWPSHLVDAIGGGNDEVDDEGRVERLPGAAVRERPYGRVGAAGPRPAAITTTTMSGLLPLTSLGARSPSGVKDAERPAFEGL